MFVASNSKSSIVVPGATTVKLLGIPGAPYYYKLPPIRPPNLRRTVALTYGRLHLWLTMTAHDRWVLGAHRQAYT